jgi:hypothetical protein
MKNNNILVVYVHMRLIVNGVFKRFYHEKKLITHCN